MMLTTTSSIRTVTGLELRYAIVLVLLDAGRPLRVTELVDQLERLGLQTIGRPGKTVADAIRWEVRRGRVRQLGRGLYGPGRVPRSTMYHMRRRLSATTNAAA